MFEFNRPFTGSIATIIWPCAAAAYSLSEMQLLLQGVKTVRYPTCGRVNSAADFVAMKPTKDLS
jgi:hypothetical protein